MLLIVACFLRRREYVPRWSYPNWIRLWGSLVTHSWELPTTSDMSTIHVAMLDESFLPEPPLISCICIHQAWMEILLLVHLQFLSLIYITHKYSQQEWWLHQTAVPSPSKHAIFSTLSNAMECSVLSPFCLQLHPSMAAIGCFSGWLNWNLFTLQSVCIVYGRNFSAPLKPVEPLW